MKLTRKQAIDTLIDDFINKCIADDWQYLDEKDWAIVKALKIKVPRGS